MNDATHASRIHSRKFSRQTLPVCAKGRMPTVASFDVDAAGPSASSSNEKGPRIAPRPWSVASEPF